MQLSLSLVGDDDASERLEKSLLSRRGVDWAAVIRVTNRVVSLGADTVSLTIAKLERFSPLPALPAGLTATAGLLENAPRLRGMIEERLGTAPPTSRCRSHRRRRGIRAWTARTSDRHPPPGAAITEIAARRASWDRREPELWADRIAARSGPVETPKVRSRRGERARFASLTAAGITLPATNNLERASAALAAGMPKAARLGREAFATDLGRVLAQHGILAFDLGVLRLLDRVGVVVVEDRLLHPGGVRLVGGDRPVRGHDRAPSDVPPQSARHPRAGPFLRSPTLRCHATIARGAAGEGHDER